MQVNKNDPLTRRAFFFFPSLTTISESSILTNILPSVLLPYQIINKTIGKTTILYRLQNESDEAVQTIPTIGFNVETLQYKNIKVCVHVK